MKEINAKLEAHKEILHKYGNKLNTHEMQIKSCAERMDILNEHREKHHNDIIIIQAKQDHAVEAMTELSKSIKDLTKKITSLFTIKNMVLGGCITLSIIVGMFGYVLKMILDHYQ